MANCQASVVKKAHLTSYHKLAFDLYILCMPKLALQPYTYFSKIIDHKSFRALTKDSTTVSCDGADKQLAVSETGEGADSLGYELEVIGDAEAGTSGKVLGSREFARYYKQHHKPADMRTSVQVNTVIAKYVSWSACLLSTASCLDRVCLMSTLLYVSIITLQCSAASMCTA